MTDATHADGLVPDRVSRISELDTVAGCRLLARNEAIVAGASSGAVVQAFLQAAPGLAAGARVVLVLHDLALAMNHADRVLVLDGGEVVADGAPEAALSPAIVERVWGVSARWLGEAGARALVAS